MPVTGGTSVINVVAVAPDGGTADVQRVNGTLLLNVEDPVGDDHRPGNYAYPTSPAFDAGAFDVQKFQALGHRLDHHLPAADGRPDPHLSPPGAQLVDAYVNDPSAGTLGTSTAASFAQRNFTIASGSAWNRLIELQGFGPRYIDAHGNMLGTVNISANSISRFITSSVDKETLGMPKDRLGVYRRADRAGLLQPPPGAGLCPQRLSRSSSASVQLSAPIPTTRSTRQRSPGSLI